MKQPLEKGLQYFKGVAKGKLEPLGLHVEELLYNLVSDQTTSGDCLAVCVKASTPNESFFGVGKDYDNGQRAKLNTYLREHLSGSLNEVVGMPTFFGAFVHLSEYEPLKKEDPPFETDFEIGHGFVDTTKTIDLDIIPVESAVNQGLLRKDSLMYSTCQKYGLKSTVKQGYQLVAPDPIAADLVNSICGVEGIRSVLEFGGGVGTTGVAASYWGVEDITYVDISPKICSYLKDQFPHTTVVEQAANDFTFEREYDLVMISIPYSRIPWFLKEKGEELAKHSGIVALQSGVPGMYVAEHEMEKGNPLTQWWPWFDRRMSLPTHFENVQEGEKGYQTALIASNEGLEAVTEMMSGNGMKTKITYTPV